MNKVIVRIKGGLGNQLFSYAATRRLALMNHAELIIDDETGFTRDRRYGRKYALDHFQILARKATPGERFEPFERLRRGLVKCVSRSRPFHRRRYIEQVGIAFDRRLLDLDVVGTVYCDGYWQSERYFKDVEKTVREDLQFIPPADAKNQQMAKLIRQRNAVAIHVRWFDPPENESAGHNLPESYYRRAVTEVERRVDNPHYFLFSDHAAAARRRLAVSDERVTSVEHNPGDDSFADLWLMTQCKHFIIANSTFSWWGAWLAGPDSKIVVAPSIKQAGISAWGFEGLIPDGWMTL